jgi:serine/threonine protein kinase
MVYSRPRQERADFVDLGELIETPTGVQLQLVMPGMTYIENKTVGTRYYLSNKTALVYRDGKLAIEMYTEWLHGPINSEDRTIVYPSDIRRFELEGPAIYSGFNYRGPGIGDVPFTLEIPEGKSTRLDTGGVDITIETVNSTLELKFYQDWKSRQSLQSTTEAKPEDTTPLVPIRQRYVIGEKYIVTGDLASSVMSNLYYVTEISSGDSQVLKVVSMSVGRNPTIIENFEREIKILNTLDHPCIVPILDDGVHVDGRPYYVMSFFRGGHLAKSSRSLPLSTRNDILLQVADGLNYLHDNGVVHADVKPRNILLDEFNNAFLSDFGIARRIDEQEDIQPFSGTVDYAPPEQRRGERIGPAADVYALAATAYRVLTLTEDQPISDGVTQVEVQTSAYVADALTPAHEVNPELPPAVWEVLRPALSENPDDRPTMAEFRAGLIEAFGGGEQTDDDTLTFGPWRVVDEVLRWNQLIFYTGQAEGEERLVHIKTTAESVTDLERHIARFSEEADLLNRIGGGGITRLLAMDVLPDGRPYRVTPHYQQSLTDESLSYTLDERVAFIGTHRGGPRSNPRNRLHP